jgi:hypothetical protein
MGRCWNKDKRKVEFCCTLRNYMKNRFKNKSSGQLTFRAEVIIAFWAIQYTYTLCKGQILFLQIRGLWGMVKRRVLNRFQKYKPKSHQNDVEKSDPDPVER